MPQMPQATPADPRQAQNRAHQPHGKRPQARTGILNRRSGSRLVKKPTANALKRSIGRAPQAASARRHHAVNAASLPARRSFDSARCARSAQDDRVGDIPLLIGERRQARPRVSRRKAHPHEQQAASERSDASGAADGGDAPPRPARIERARSAMRAPPQVAPRPASSERAKRRERARRWHRGPQPASEREARCERARRLQGPRLLQRKAAA